MKGIGHRAWRETTRRPQYDPSDLRGRRGETARRRHCGLRKGPWSDQAKNSMGHGA